METAKLGLGLHPLGHYLQPEAVGQGDGTGHDGRVVVVGVETGHERPVDLQEVDGQPLQVSQGREAGAEIVEADLHP